MYCPMCRLFFFFSLDTFRGKLTSETGMGDGSEGAQLLGLSLPSIDPHPRAASGLGRQAHARLVRLRAGGIRGLFGIIGARVALSTKTCMWGSQQKTQSPPGPRAWGLVGVLDIAGQVLVRMFLKFYIYIPRLGTKISVYLSLTLISIFLIEKSHRKRCL